MRIVRYTYPNYRSPAVALGGFARSPWSGFETEIDRLFQSSLADFGGASSSACVPVDLHVDKDHLYFRAELPGVKRDDISVELTDGVLSISAVRKSPSSDGKTDESVSLSRSVSIPEIVQADKVSATYENGILTVTLPKAEAAKPLKIAVN